MTKNIIYLILLLSGFTGANAELYLKEWNKFSDSSSFDYLTFNKDYLGSILGLCRNTHDSISTWKFSSFSQNSGAKVIGTADFPRNGEAVRSYFLYNDSVYFTTYQYFPHDSSQIAFYKIENDGVAKRFKSSTVKTYGEEFGIAFFADSSYYYWNSPSSIKVTHLRFVKYNRFGDKEASINYFDTTICISNIISCFRNKSKECFVVASYDMSYPAKSQIVIYKFNENFEFVKKDVIYSDLDYFIFNSSTCYMDEYENIYIVTNLILNGADCYVKYYKYSLKDSKLLVNKTGPLTSSDNQIKINIIATLFDGDIFLSGYYSKQTSRFNRIYNHNFDSLSFEDNSNYTFNSAKTDKTGSLFLTGNKKLGSQSSEFLIVELNTKTSKIFDDCNSNIITTSPNPSANYVDISVPESVSGKACNVSVYSYTGSKIYEEFIDVTNSLRLNVSYYPVGAYTVVLTTPDRAIPVTIVVQR